jgi:ABC-type nitrate/sulfonate/bicarbonate transport system substrate-binding protein
MESVKIGIGVSSIGRFLPWIALRSGLFERRGIAAAIVNQQDEEKVVQDIASGTTPIGTPNAPSLLFAQLNGADLVIVGGILNRPAFYLVGGANIRSVGDLKAKKLGINQPRRMAGMMMLALLRQWQLDRATDLDLVDLGINDRSLEALRAGELDAALLPPEKAFLAEAEGFSVVADTRSLTCHWVPLATTRRFLEANRELVARVAASYRESLGIFRRDKTFALEEIARQLPALARRPVVLEKCYAVFAELFEPSLEASPGALEAILREVALQDARAAHVRAEALIERVI